MRFARGIASLLVVSFVVATAACGKSKGSKPKDVADAAKLVELGQCPSAVEKMQAFVSSHPSELEAYLVLGDAATCVAYANAPTIAADQLEVAEQAYSSAMKLAPKDLRVLLSRAALGVFTNREDARARIDAVLALDPKNRTAVNLLVALEPSAEAIERFDAVYAGRKPAAIAPPTPGVCSSGGACGSGILLADTTLDGRPYEAGTIFAEVQMADGKVGFVDRVHPEKGKGSGWTVTRVRYDTGGAFAETRTFDNPNPRVVRDRVPDLPVVPNSGDPYDQSIRAAQAEQDRWNHRYWEPAGVQALEDQLGVIPDILPDSVKPRGDAVVVNAILDETMWGRGRKVVFGFDLTPVKYEQQVYATRTIDPALVARVATSEGRASQLVAVSTLSADEKRALLYGRLFAGVPLGLALLALGGDADDRAVLSIAQGKVSVTVGDGEPRLTFVDGELTGTPPPLGGDPFDDPYQEGDGE